MKLRFIAPLCAAILLALPVASQAQERKLPEGFRLSSLNDLGQVNVTYETAADEISAKTRKLQTLAYDADTIKTQASAGVSPGGTLTVFSIYSDLVVFNLKREVIARDKAHSGFIIAKLPEVGDGFICRLVHRYDDSFVEFMIDKGAPLTEKEARAEVVKQFPELGVQGSKLNREFLTRFARYQADNPEFFRSPDWPFRLAAQVVAESKPDKK